MTCDKPGLMLITIQHYLQPITNTYRRVIKYPAKQTGKTYSLLLTFEPRCAAVDVRIGPEQAHRYILAGINK